MLAHPSPFSVANPFFVFESLAIDSANGSISYGGSQLNMELA
jgi:hypothetical protein